MTHTPIKPWYREPWPWLLMLAPAAAVAAGAITIAFAMQSFDGLVAEDYYKQGLAVNQRLARAQVAQALGITARLAFEAGTDGEVRAQLSGRSSDETQLVLTLSHPTRAGLDQRVVLQPTGNRHYVGGIAMLAPGRWHVIMEDAAAGWRIRGELHIPQERSATLTPGA